MSSSPSSVKQRSPKRSSPIRLPLQQQTSSQTNEISFRVNNDSRARENLDIYNANPFPTKPSQVLLPSTLRNKKSFVLSPISDSAGFLSDSDAGGSSVSKSSRGSRPTVRLKRSVKALRDLYEAQAEDSSRPSTATSPPLRPGTASSLRLRSISSSESLSGAYAWEKLRATSNDDLALLPTLPSGTRALRRQASRQSFTSIAENAVVPSSPNFNVLGATSSPRPAGFKDLSDALAEDYEEPPSTSSAPDSSSSPNIVRLAHTSSTENLPSTDQSSSPNIVRLGHTSSIEQFGGSDPFSSPNVVKLGTSSPERSPTTARRLPSDESIPSRSSSTSSRKRKRSDTGGGRSFAERVGARNPLASSPPVNAYRADTTIVQSSSPPVDLNIPSSAPQSVQQSSVIDESSPVVRVYQADEPSSDDYSIADTHASLQAALSSSPPRIQYPVVRAPPPSQHISINVPKRNSRSMSTEGSVPRFSSALSAVPSESSWFQSRPISQISEASSASEDLEEYLKSEELEPATSYVLNQSANQTQIHLVPEAVPQAAVMARDTESDHDSIDSHGHEATDEVSALPMSEYAYRSPPLRPTWSGSQLGGSSSSSNSAHQSMVRLNSLKQLPQRNSFLRPSSSSSSVYNPAPVPSWARRYYSGAYRDSFQFLYSPASYMSLRSLAAGQAPIPVSTLTPAPSRQETARSSAGPSLRNLHRSMTERMGDLLNPKRPKVEARKSHIVPGIGPLVSNPSTKLAPPAPTAAHPFAHGARRQSYQHPQTQYLVSSQHNRSASMPLPPADPRAHWAGVVEIHEYPNDDGRGASYAIRHHSYTYSGSASQADSASQSVIIHPNGNGLRRSWHRWSSSPHLHHDARLNTGSSVSRGFGFPFNAKSRWTTGAPELFTTGADTSGSIFHLDARSFQVMAFITGFLLPITWIIAAFVPLPERPHKFEDIEKQVFRESRQQWRESRAQRQSYLATHSRTQSFRHSRQSRESEWDPNSLDILARLRLERHHAGVEELRYQNARWWRNLNRWMSIVGVVVIVLVVVLAILGTKGNW
jgi:hypothetical protein